jgi:hypothetical protein
MDNNHNKRNIGNSLTPWETIDNGINDDLSLYMENQNNIIHDKIITKHQSSINPIPLTIASQNLDHNNNKHVENPDTENNILSQAISKAIIVASSGILNKIDGIKSEKDAKALSEEIQNFISSDNCNNINEILEKIEKKIDLINQEINNADKNGFFSNEDDEAEKNNQAISNILQGALQFLKKKLEHSESSTPKSSKSGFSSDHSSYTNYNPEYNNPFIALSEKNGTLKAFKYTSSAIRDNIEKTELENKIKILKNDRGLMQNSLNLMKRNEFTINETINEIETILQNKNDDNFVKQVNELAKKLNDTMKSLCTIQYFDKDKNQEISSTHNFMPTFELNEKIPEKGTEQWMVWMKDRISINNIIEEQPKPKDNTLYIDDKDQIINYLNKKIQSMKNILDGQEVKYKYSDKNKYPNSYKNVDKIPGLNDNINSLSKKIEGNKKEIIGLEEKLHNNPIKYKQITNQYPKR